MAILAPVTLDSSGNVTGIFGTPQNEPTPHGYALIASDDPRIVIFLNRGSNVAASRRSYVAQLKGQAATAQRKGNTARAISLLIQAQEFING